MCVALSADAIFVNKHSGKTPGTWQGLFGRGKEKRKYLKEFEMNGDGGMNAVFGCRRLCGKFWTPWWVYPVEHTGSYVHDCLCGCGIIECGVYLMDCVCECRVVHVREDLAVQIICDDHHKQLTHAVSFVWQPIGPQCMQHVCTLCTLHTMNVFIVCPDGADLEEKLRWQIYNRLRIRWCLIANNNNMICPDSIIHGIHAQSHQFVRIWLSIESGQIILLLFAASLCR